MKLFGYDCKKIFSIVFDLYAIVKSLESIDKERNQGKAGEEKKWD